MIVPFPPGLAQIVLPVKTSAIGLATVAIVIALLLEETQPNDAFVPIT